MKLEKYLKDVVSSVGIEVSDDGKLLTSSGKEITYDSMPIVLPNSNTVNNQKMIVNGVLTQVHTIFNPFSEDELKRNQMLVTLMRYMSAISTAGVLSGVIMLLVELLENENAQASASTKIQNWITQLKSKVKGNLIDKKTSKEIKKVIFYLVENRLDLIKYRTSKGATVAGIKYTRLAKLDMTALDVIKDQSDEIGISEKTKTILLSMISFIFPEIENMYAGSKHQRYPSYIAAMELYDEVQGRINFLLAELSEIFEGAYDTLIMPLVEDISVDSMVKEIEFLPNQNKLDIPQGKDQGLLSTLQNTVTSISGNTTTTLTESGDIPDGIDLLIARTRGAKNNAGFINHNGTQIFDQRVSQTGMTMQQALQQAQAPTNSIFGNQQQDVFGFNNNNNSNGSIFSNQSQTTDIFGFRH